jgi:hypothetical protein
MIAAAGNVYRTHRVIIHLAPVTLHRAPRDEDANCPAAFPEHVRTGSKEKPDTAKKRIRQSAGDALVDHPLIGCL